MRTKNGNRRRRWPLWLGVTLLLCVAVRAILPSTIELAIERGGGGLLGRRLDVSDVDLEVLAGRAHLRGLDVGAPLPSAPTGEDPGESAILSIDRVLVDFDWLRLLALELRFGRIEAERPSLHVPLRAPGWPTPLVLPESRPEWIRPWVERLDRWVRRVRAPVHLGGRRGT